MKRTIVTIGFVLLAALLIFVFGGRTWADDAAKAEVKTQTLCPIMGNPVNKDVYQDYEGKRVYFCCAACFEKFNADPAGCIKKMEDEGITLAKAEDDGGHHDGDHGGDHEEHGTGDDHGHDKGEQHHQHHDHG